MKKYLILPLLLLSACNYQPKSKLPFEETKHTIQQAELYKDQRPLPQKAEIYESILFQRHFQQKPYPWFTDSIKLKENSDPLGFSDPIRKDNINDAAVVGSLIPSYLCYKYQFEKQNNLPTYDTEQKIKDTFTFIETLCTISNIEGLVVHGYVPPNSNINPKDFEKPHHQTIKDGKYKDFIVKFDASPPQFSGIIRALSDFYFLGPDQYKERSKQLLLQISRYFIKTNYTIIDINNKPTTTGYLKYPTTLIQYNGIGIYFDPKFYKFETGNQGHRNLILLLLFKTTAAISNDPEIIQIYNNMNEEVNQAINSSFNIANIKQAGEELSKFPILYYLLRPESNFQDPFKQQYLDYLNKLWNTYKSYKHTLAISTHSSLTNDKTNLQDAINTLDSFPFPKRPITIINSNAPDVKLENIPYIGKTIEPISTPDSILPLWRQGAGPNVWSEDPRKVDSNGSGTKEFSYADFLFAYWFMKYHNLL